MKKLILFTLVLIPMGLFAQGGEGVLEELFGKYFISTAVFAGAVMALTTLIDKYVGFLDVPTQVKSFIAGAVLGALGYIASLGIFAEATLVEALMIVVTTTLGSNGIFDFIFKTLGKKDVSELDSVGHPVK